MRIFREADFGKDNEPSPVEEEARIRSNLSGARAIVAFGSARGGVGKSALLANIAAVLALAGRKIVIVDADLNSPSIMVMLGMKASRRGSLGDEIEPASGPLGLRIVSSELLPEGDFAISFVGLDENAAALQNGSRPSEFGYLATMRRLLGGTHFGAVDLILVDLAAGLEQIYRILKIAPEARLLLSSHPSELSARATQSAMEIVQRFPGCVLGLVENMAGFSCEGCHRVRPLMPYGALAVYARNVGVPILERLPFDPRFAESCDRGVIFVREYQQTPMAKQLVALARTIDKATSSAQTGVGISA
jgi:ATP-binding protein involved in chromosome partitioning